MNTSLTLYTPTHLIWVFEPNCSCPSMDNLCIRPVIFGQPVICVHSLIGTNFHYFLEKKPANDDNQRLLWTIFAMVLLIMIGKVFPQPNVIVFNSLIF